MLVQNETAGAIAAAVCPFFQTLTPSSGQKRPYIYIRSLIKKFLFEQKYVPFTPKNGELTQSFVFYCVYYDFSVVGQLVMSFK